MPEHSNGTQGMVFNVQKYSVHDGPGIRTIVFLKGCPLHCRWCSNPESQRTAPELAYNPAKCLGIEKCGRCLEVCTAGALTTNPEGRLVINRETCCNCMLCAEACPAVSLTVYGKAMTVDQVLAVVEQDAIFYSRSGGGMTLSGGEPLMQPDFALALLREARRRRIGTALETAGHCGWEQLAAACGLLDYLLYDIKTMDPARHQAFTGVSNEVILENLRRVRERFPDLPILVRTPVIPGVNDSEEDLAAIEDFLRGMPNLSRELLPYHRLAQPKYGYIGRAYPMGDAVLAQERMDRLLAAAGRRKAAS